jgi:hypothetical protein
MWHHQSQNENCCSVGVSDRPTSWGNGERDVNDISFHRLNIGRIDEEPPSETVGQTAENRGMFLTLEDKSDFGAAVFCEPCRQCFSIRTVGVMEEEIVDTVQLRDGTLEGVG